VEKFNGTKHVSMIGNSTGLKTIFFECSNQIFDTDCSLKQRILRVKMKVGEHNCELFLEE
jgi:hypothetical protein